MSSDLKHEGWQGFLSCDTVPPAAVKKQKELGGLQQVLICKGTLENNVCLEL